MATELYINVLPDSVTVTDIAEDSALANIKLITEYAFDGNVVAKIQVTDDKSTPPTKDPLNNLVFNIVFADKVDDSVITQMQGRLYTGGGADSLEEDFPNNFTYITQKLDFYGALDSSDDFFEEVETTYDPANKEQVIAALNEVGALKDQGTYRTSQVVATVPATIVEDVDPEVISAKLIDMQQQPRYMVVCNPDDLQVIEAVAKVMDKLNNNFVLDLGPINNWQAASALAESIGIDDHRFWIYWNPNISRPSNSASVLARKKWRPCVGDYLGQALIRNANTNASGIPPLNKPLAGYNFPVNFRDMEPMPGVTLDEEAQNALADAGVNVVLNERFEGGSRYIYGDALTQYDSKTSALRLTNASEITTYIDNTVVSIAKKHLLKGMSSFVDDADAECRRFLNACSSAELLRPVEELAGKLYGLEISPRQDDPFSKVDIKLIKRPEGCARQIFFTTTVTK